jgi:capsular polysaccharide transport system permease protein
MQEWNVFCNRTTLERLFYVSKSYQGLVAYSVGDSDSGDMSPDKKLTALPNPSFIARISALVEREQRTRYAGGPLGYFWAFVGPISWIAFVVVFFRIIGRQPPLQVGVEVFVATGILPYALWRQNLQMIMRTVIANRHMTAYDRIDSRELAISSSILEYGTNLMTAAVIFGVFAMLFDVSLPADTLKVLMSFFAVWVLGAGVGSLFASIGQVSDSFHRGVQVILRPLFWISGLFFTATELPASTISLFWWNPLFHCIDALREGLFLGFQSPISSLWYPIVFGAVCFLLAMHIMVYVDDNRLSRHPL